MTETARITELEAENERLRAFAFGAAPEWVRANATLKHCVRERETERDRYREALTLIIGADPQGAHAIAREALDD